MKPAKKHVPKDQFDMGRFRYLIEASKYRTRRITAGKKKNGKGTRTGYIVPFSPSAAPD
jgi:hypothetical protein